MKSRLLKILGTLTFSFAFIIGVACINVHASWEIIPSEDGNILKIHNDEIGGLIRLNHKWVRYEPEHLVIEGVMGCRDFEILSAFSYDYKTIDLSSVKTKEIPSNIFNLNENLVKFIFPEDLKIIGESSFMSCYNLREVVLPKNLEEIQDYSFQKCENLEFVISPKVKLGKRVFFGCPNLKVCDVINQNITPKIFFLHCFGSIFFNKTKK